MAYDGLQDAGDVMSDGLPRFYGIYRGTVHDARDPQGKNRLMCIVPAVGGKTDPLDWAMPCFSPLKPVTLSSTSGAGAHTHTLLPDGSVHLKLPARGDTVWVMFEAGDARHPVWMGTWRF